jgi:hypothetical protein
MKKDVVVYFYCVLFLNGFKSFGSKPFWGTDSQERSKSWSDDSRFVWSD